MKTSEKIFLYAIPVFGMLPCQAKQSSDAKAEPRPNILLVINDDQSFPYASAYGCNCISTPGFDFVASNGVLFNNAYVTSPGSSPSRASILTGLYPWQIEEAGTHASSFPSKYKTYVDILEENGYSVGFTGKGWGPGDWKASGRTRNPAGPAFNALSSDVPFTGISKIDYAANFKAFLDSKPEDKPFCFWLGPNEPHRGYEKDSWQKAGHDLKDVEVPSYLPDVDEIRGDILDYVVEAEWADLHLLRALQELQNRGMLENTLIIAMADNGMSFPHAKANCYGDGLHIPLAICWTGKASKGITVDQNVSSIDLMPTILEAAGIKPSQMMSGASLMPILTGKADSSRDLLSGRERHSSSRPGNLGYPIRSIRRGDWLLVHNFHPERWPAGDPQALKKDGTPAPMDAAYHDIDACPTSSYIISHKNDPQIRPYYAAGMMKRPEFELFNLADDPGCMHNLSEDPGCRTTLKKMKAILNRRLKKSKDTRLGNNPEIWESYPRLVGEIRQFPE